MDLSHFNRIVGRFASQRILVIGDLMLDEFIWGKVSRISPEAPVPVVNVTSESYYPGGAANVARNIREFTAHTGVMGTVGTDAPGERLLGLLRASGIDTTGIQQSPGCPTALKTRIIARNQQVVRVDRERKVPLDAGQIEHAMSYLDAAAGELDAVIVADYGKGFLAQSMADHICEWARRHRKILTIDPHPHTSLLWNGPTAVKPNRSEAFLAAGVPASDAGGPVLADHALLEAGQQLLAKWNTGSLLITLGEQGMLLLQPQSAPYHVPSLAQTVFDVSGAGDTAIAIFTLALSAGASMSEAAAIANCASGIVVGKFGTATVTVDELLGAIAAL